ncbi:MAG: ammonia-forming cytochrome c nitrite reductase subunit c552 [Bacteroidia bacterium]|nr:ammonia-forming cytochrome c nitrite reductase subunit c552 [Bacteroidia bacterium]
MKTNNKLKFLTYLLAFAMIGLWSCEGDQGPIGLTGPAGVDGTTGEVGPSGPTGPAGEGVQDCKQCHGNSQLITAKLAQWEKSVHATGGRYERNFSSCAGCHTSQGFLERIASGEMNASGTVQDPLPQNCYTCHQVHSTYTQEDWNLTSSDPVTLWVGGETVDLGNSSLCINCHQARVPSPALPPVGEDAVYEVTNKRYGPHHGAQGLMFSGQAAYLIGEGYENSLHTTLIDNACVNCHMATVMGQNEAGGHTFRVASEDGELNTAGCIQCHSDEDALLATVDETQTEITDLLNQLGTRLNELGILDDNLEYALVPIELTSLQVGILWNYKYVLEDQSNGIHNYKFAKKLLENSLEALE